MLSAACAIGALVLRSPELLQDPPNEMRVEATQLGVASYRGGYLEGLRRELDGARPANLFTACPTLREHLPAGVRIAEAGDVRDADARIPPPGGPPLRRITVFTVHAPVFRDGGRRAVVLVTRTCPGLCGGGVAVELRRHAGDWRVDRVRGLWVS